MNILIINRVITVFAKIFGEVEGHKKPSIRKYRRKEKNQRKIELRRMPWILKPFLQVVYVCGERITIISGFSFIESGLRALLY